MSSAETQIAPDTPVPPAAAAGLAALRDRIAALFSGAPHEVVAGHADLAEGIWISTDPEGQGRIALAPADGHIVLTLAGGDSGRWCSLGLRLPAEALAPARYLGLLVALRSADFIAYAPTLRYNLHEGGMRDVTAAPAVMAGGTREILSHVPVDPALLAESRDCEFNLFFDTDAFSADLLRLEPLLIL